MNQRLKAFELIEDARVALNCVPALALYEHENQLLQQAWDAVIQLSAVLEPGN